MSDKLTAEQMADGIAGDWLGSPNDWYSLRRGCAAMLREQAAEITKLKEDAVDWDAIEKWAVKHGTEEGEWEWDNSDKTLDAWHVVRDGLKVDQIHADSLPKASRECREEVNAAEVEAAVESHEARVARLDQIEEQLEQPQQPESALDECCQIKGGVYLRHSAIAEAMREIRDRLNKLEGKPRV